MLISAPRAVRPAPPPATRAAATTAAASLRPRRGGRPVAPPPPPARRAPTARRARVAARAVLDVDEASFEKDVLQSPTPVLVDVWADWCGPCKLVAPLLPKVEAAAGGALKVVKMNADTAPSLVERYRVYGLPALLLFKDGALVPGAQREGAVGLAPLLEWVASFGVPVAGGAPK